VEHDKIVCLDIETVPDRALIPDWDEGKFPPKPIWHRIVAISFVEARIEYDKGLPEKYAVACCRSSGGADWDEQRLLSKFWQYFTECAPRVVTWNGKGFDLPVLRARAMMYGISAQSWYQRGTKWDSYMQRFAPDWHCDLMEQHSTGQPDRADHAASTSDIKGPCCRRPEEIRTDFTTLKWVNEYALRPPRRQSPVGPGGKPLDVVPSGNRPPAEVASIFSALRVRVLPRTLPVPVFRLFRRLFEFEIRWRPV
jgi:hypothetical protein